MTNFFTKTPTLLVLRNSHGQQEKVSGKAREECGQAQGEEGLVTIGFGSAL